jgi:hypothetical protein
VLSLKRRESRARAREAETRFDFVCQRAEHFRRDETLRIAGMVARIAARLPHGNVHGTVYVNRNMTGAVVGHAVLRRGLSGTGPKAGGPGYRHRLAPLRNFARVLALMLALRFSLRLWPAAMFCLLRVPRCVVWMTAAACGEAGKWPG